MSLSFVCESERRRDLLLAQTGGPGARLDGIDLVLVLDEDDDPGAMELRQRVLLVRLLFGDELGTLSGDNVAIEGGVRVRNPRVVWATPMSVLDPSTVAPALSSAAQLWLSGVIAGTAPDVRTRTLVVFVESPGDFSTYRLRLLGTTPEFEERFDVRSLELDFSFKVECPAPFDCAPVKECRTESETAPQLDYLARDFSSFRRLMFDRLALLQPNEGIEAAATLRTTLLEVLAYAADRAAYHQDAVATEAYLGTARQRRSVRRHGRLLGYRMHEGCNARTFVHLRLLDGVRVDAGALRAGTVFRTAVPDLGTVVEPHEVDNLPPSVLGFQAVMPAGVLSAAHNEITLHTWGDEKCCLLAGATCTDLVDTGDLELAPGDLLLFEQVRSPETGAEADADPDERWVVRLTHVSDPIQDRLMSDGLQVRRVTWHSDDAPKHDVPIVGDPATFLVARANLVLVDQGLPVEEAPVLDTYGRDSYGRGARVLARLREKPLTFSEAIDVRLSATKLLRQDPRNALPQVTLRGEGQEWTTVHDLLNSSSSAAVVVVEVGDDYGAWLRFGDDEFGRRPSQSSVSESQRGTEAPFVAKYRIGNGAQGNVGSGAISHIVADVEVVDAAVTASVVALHNPVPAVGGTDRESIDEVQLYAPVAFRRQERAVTAHDWAEVAKRDPRVSRAVARYEWTGSWTTAFVHVDVVGGEPVKDELRHEMHTALDRFRMAGIDLEVRGPVYVPLDIAMSVCLEDGFFPEHVETELRRVFGRGRLADGRPAFFHPDQYTFGQSVYLSAMLARAMEVPGVRWLDATPTLPGASIEHRFKRLWAPDDGSLANGRIDIGDLEIARCDSDPNTPENGQVRFFVHSPNGASQ